MKPGLCAWDHWWSGEVKMEMDVIKEYIDLASAQGWPYMLIDWQWYGPYNEAKADITRPAPQLDMPEILRYAKEKGVRIWLWLYSSDVNRNDAYKEAFRL
ncbi:MAG: glycoside hydrolase family 97 catalytic domain-containing protein, partial [Bacteroidales bacterium]|nr:glycoside hydrolase family 97 catalytic domain-containing protein [Bacteroidales bacterium]